jgi:hypothetical protein
MSPSRLNRSNNISPDGESAGTKQPGGPSLEDSGLVKEEIREREDAASNLQSVFNKYIDNKLLLIIQEQRFPRKIDIILLEPSSFLQWRFVIEPRLITTGVSSLKFLE